MRQTAPLRNGSLPTARTVVVWSLVGVLLPFLGVPPLQACDAGTAVPDPGNNPGLVADCKVLLEIRDKLDVANSLNWDIQLAITSWDNVQVSGSPSRVTWLDPGDSQLTGPIPPELGQLSYLQGLWLQNNQLTGPIPPELGQLYQLRDLVLRHNQLTGPIPPELSQLSQLSKLLLNNNQITRLIPPELGQLTYLNSLDLRSNQLKGKIPSELGQLSHLSELLLNDNQITGLIPLELGQLTQLNRLDLHNNQLTGKIPVALDQLSQLNVLHLQDNQLTGKIPSELGQLSQLQELRLENNQLTGEIPPQLGQLSQLSTLWLHNNRLTGSIPSELGRLSRLEDLDLHNNQLRGKIPPQLGQLTRLQELPLYNNQLTGPIPPQLGQLTRLQHLVLFNNRLTGDIPRELGQLSQLQYLTLFNNQLTGEIPVELTRLNQLWSLALDRNQLTGTIPLELGRLTQLRWLTLDHNRLTGEIPPELGQLSQLRWLLLGTNELTGKIPPELGQLSQLRWLSLGHNQLTGEIPPELGQLAQLQRLHLENNRLTGPIPHELGQLPNLEQFTYWGNRLTGPDPSEPDAEGSFFVPVILTSAGLNNAFFTSELTLTNRGSEEATLHFTYTADRGGGSGAATDRLAPGRQRIEPDAIGYLAALGIPIPDRGNRIGTLRVAFSGSSQVSVVVRTTTAVPGGRAGLAYPGIGGNEGFRGVVYLCGLRESTQDRSNVALQNMGASEDGSITLRTTVFPGDTDNASPRVVGDVKLQPGGFHQFNQVLKGLGSPAQGYVKVEKVEGKGPFYAYGVINDQSNSDGSFVFPVTASSLVGTSGQTLPVIIETGAFKSELTVTNFSALDKQLDFSFVADAIADRDDTAEFGLKLKAGEQTILPDIVAELRRNGVAGIGPAGRAFVGALFATPAEGDMSGIVIGARTGAPDKRGGQYSLFYNGVPYGSASTESAWIYGLQQNAENRSNLALVNTGEIDDSDSTFEITIYDGSGGTEPRTKSVTLGPRRWTQENGILGNVSQGYVQVRKISGNNPFVTYGVVNDGGRPGQRSGDGAFLLSQE